MAGTEFVVRIKTAASIFGTCKWVCVSVCVAHATTDDVDEHTSVWTRCGRCSLKTFDENSPECKHRSKCNPNDCTARSQIISNKMGFLKIYPRNYRFSFRRARTLCGEDEVLQHVHGWCARSLSAPCFGTYDFGLV